MESIFAVGGSLRPLESMRGGANVPISSSLIFGPPQSCKTALLMQAAVTEGNHGNLVLFIAPKRISRLPPSVHGMPVPSSVAMNNIRFLYASSSKELQIYLASLHLKSQNDRPMFIVVDDLNFYCSSLDMSDKTNQLVCLSKMLALIQEAASFCSRSQLPSVHSEAKEQRLSDSNVNKVVCGILISWTHYGSNLIRIAEVEKLAGDCCYHVWKIEGGKQKSSVKEFELVQHFPQSTCKISYMLKKSSKLIQYLILQQVTLDIEENDECDILEHSSVE